MFGCRIWMKGNARGVFERDIIDRTILNNQNNSTLVESLVRRRALLTNEEDEGMTDNLFWKLPQKDRLYFSSGSLFVEAPATDAEIFSAVSAALQEKRRSLENAGYILGGAGYPVRTVLNHDEYLYKVFTDSMLRACFLRSADHFELIHVNQDREKHRAMCSKNLIMNGEVNEHDIAAEMLFHYLAGKIFFPKESICVVKNRLSELGLENYRDLINRGI